MILKVIAVFSLVVLLFVFSLRQAMAQDSMLKKIKNMHWPEKRWAVTHPFVLLKSWKITNEAREKAAQMKFDPDLDGDENGGQVDAFRHAFWMALLASEIKPKKALKLGIAHEKGNYIDYKKRHLEEGTVPDFMSGEMDMRNNKAGIQIAEQNKYADSEALALLVKKAILEGNLWVIKKDKVGNFLDWQGKTISIEDYEGKWHTPKCLVPSNFQRPEMSIDE